MYSNTVSFLVMIVWVGPEKLLLKPCSCRSDNIYSSIITLECFLTAKLQHFTANRSHKTPLTSTNEFEL